MTTTPAPPRPADAGSDLRCQRCSALLAVRTAGTYAIKHRGKEIVCRELLSVKCDKCGEVRSLTNGSINGDRGEEDAENSI